MTLGGFGGQVIFMPGHPATATVVVIDMSDGQGPRQWIKIEQGDQVVGWFDSVDDIIAHGIDPAALTLA